MTGDGINDPSALAQAGVALAIGSGSDIAAETSGIVLVNGNPKDIVLSPAAGTVLTSVSKVIVHINAGMLKVKK